MSRLAALIFTAMIFVLILLPAAVVALGRQAADIPEEPAEPADDTGDIPGGMNITVYVCEEQAKVQMGLDEYLVGVLAAEMPASFEPEALKAQAVVARTFVLYRSLFHGGTGCDKYGYSIDICTDSTHCQAWIDPAQAAEAWPAEERERHLQKLRTAVRETAGEAVFYRGQPIEAVYHSTCGGSTEASHAVWSGGAVEYLQGVTCPYCSHSPHFRRNITVSRAALAAAMPPDAALPATGPIPIQILETTVGGRVALLQVGSYQIKGGDFRRRLELPSTAFTFRLEGELVHFQACGNGHGVGLCQYGADGMAKEGKTYKEIIAYYYPGASVASLP